MCPCKEQNHSSSLACWKGRLARWQTISCGTCMFSADDPCNHALHRKSLWWCLRDSTCLLSLCMWTLSLEVSFPAMWRSLSCTDAWVCSTSKLQVKRRRIKMIQSRRSAHVRRQTLYLVKHDFESCSLQYTSVTLRHFRAVQLYSLLPILWHLLMEVHHKNLKKKAHFHPFKRKNLIGI